MRPSLSGNILFVFSDPGGAKPCLSLIEENCLKNVTVISDRQCSFYKDFKTEIRIVNQDFKQIVDKINPDLIFTGTSYTSDIERRFIKIAQNQNIPCYSFVDHWTSISKRFVAKDGEMILPDQVWVIDERARQIAIKEGIIEKKIIISGNPYHDWLRKWKPTISKAAHLSQIQIPVKGRKVLLYAPDPLSNINGLEIYGFDELSATSALVDLFEKNKTELNGWLVLVKAHPNQNRDKLNKIIAGKEHFFMLPEEIDTNTMLYYADVVMGFFSSILIEASIMKKPVFRFLDESFNNDPFAELNVGRRVNKHSFISELINFSKFDEYN